MNDLIKEIKLVIENKTNHIKSVKHSESYNKETKEFLITGLINKIKILNENIVILKALNGNNVMKCESGSSFSDCDIHNDNKHGCLDCGNYVEDN